MAEKKDKLTLQALQAHRKVQEARQDALMGLPNVVGTALSTKITAGEDTEEPSLTVFVEQKLPEDMLASGQRVPKEVDGIATDVIQTGVFFAGQEPVATIPATGGPATDVGIEVLTSRVRPAKGGFSVGHYQITAGTYATGVYDASAFPGIPSRYYILSNNHVLANSNNARINDPILQPGPYDGGVPARDTIAHLSRFVPINFSGAPNLVDAAIAEGKFEQLDREIYWIGYARGGAPAPTIGMAVQKTGRTTNWTSGTIIALNATVNVNYGSGKVARFVRQIVTSNMSAPGDSGSLLLDLDNRVVGLLFAGSSTHTIYNDIRPVQHLLGIRIA